jgi:ketosteroid isomerase-like protein
MASSKTKTTSLAQGTFVPQSPTEVEKIFYQAMREGEIEKLMACFSTDDSVFCIHADGPRIIGPVAVRTLFEAILNNGPVRVSMERLHTIETPESAVHSLVERVEFIGSEGPYTGFVLVTNVYHKTAQGWRLVCHHAGPGRNRPIEDILIRPGLLH